MRILFCDTKSVFIKAVKKRGKILKKKQEIYVIDTYCGDIRNIEADNCAYVSPANSFGYMTGGIDEVYTEMFHDVQKRVMGAIKSHNLRTGFNRYYHPVGSAVLVNVDRGKYLISSPTMWLPEDVSKTKNAYWAFRAVLYLVDKANNSLGFHHKINTIICPGLCLGYGCMKEKDSADQIFEAIYDHLAGKPYDDKTERNPFKVLSSIPDEKA